MHLGLTWFNSISDKLTYIMRTGNHPIFSALNFDPPQSGLQRHPQQSALQSNKGQKSKRYKNYYSKLQATSSTQASSSA